MYNWSHTDYAQIQNATRREIQKLEQLINFGLNGEKISEKKLRKYWDQLQLDPKRKKFLAQFL